jgi:hypothetical protein
MEEMTQELFSSPENDFGAFLFDLALFLPIYLLLEELL